MSLKATLLFVCFFGLALLPFPGLGQTIDGIIENNEYAYSQSYGEGMYELSWSVDGMTAYFALSAHTSGWVAIGFDPVTIMEGADMVFGWVDEQGVASIVDAFAIGPYGPHPADEEMGGSSNILQFAGNEKDGVTSVEFSRKLAAEDEWDKPLNLEDGTTIIWAFGDSDDITKFHDKAGYGQLGIGEVKVRGGGFGLLLVFHNVSLTLAFILMVVAMSIARYMKKKRWWLKIHRSLEITGVALSIAGIIAVEYIIISISGDHFRISHSYYGFIALFLLVLTPVIGQLILKGRKERKKLFKTVHRWLGRLALLTTIVAIIYGLIQIQIL